MAARSTAIAKPDEVSALRQLFAGKTPEAFGQDRDPDVVAYEIAMQILDGETVEDILGSRTLTSAADIVGEPIWLDGYELRPSDMDGGTGLYAIMHVRYMKNPDAKVNVSCGSTNVLAQLVRLGEKNFFPQPVKVVRSDKQSKSGYYPMWLESITEEKPF